MREQLVEGRDKIYDGTNQCLYITCHETANERVGADAQAHADLQSNGGARQASWHVQVDDKEAIRSYPDTAQCWHAGTDEGNRDSLAVEICVNADGDYDAAFRNAAEVVREWRIKHKRPRSAVKQHNYWTGKDCPHKMRLTDRWEEFLALTEPEGDTMPRMVSPFEGRLTQNHWRSGGYKGHKGMDIAPPLPGQTRMPVYAAFAGEWKKIVRNVKPGNKRSTWAPGRTGGGGLIANPDGEGNGYNHIDVLDHWKVGDKVAAGDLLGYNDRSGTQTGPHLHLEFWANWRNPDSDYDPALAFKKFGVTPGSCPTIIGTTGGTSKPISKPSSKPNPQAVAKQSRKNPPNGSTKFPTDYEDLVEDKNAGALTYGAHQILMHAIGQRLNKQWDGKFQKLTVTDTMNWLRSKGYYKVTPFAAKGARKGAKLTVDGNDGYWFWVEFQRLIKDRGFYNRAIDGNPKGYTVEAWQKFLNTQNGK